MIDNQKLTDLPNMGRNPFYEGVKVSQNVTPGGDPKFNRMEDQSGSSEISIAGGTIRGNNYLLDGISITDSMNRAVIIPTIESVQEVKLQANTYDAEVGRTGAGTIRDAALLAAAECRGAERAISRAAGRDADRAGEHARCHSPGQGASGGLASLLLKGTEYAIVGQCCGSSGA